MMEKAYQYIETLKQNLKEIFDPNYSTFGHGTHKVNAESILRTGLESANNSLDEKAVILDDSEVTFNKILQWPHRDYKSIVIVMIPNAPIGMGGYYYFDSVFEKLPEDRRSDIGAGSEFRKEYYIPPQFIRGYIDVDSLEFIKNELYDPEAKINIKEIPDNRIRARAHGERAITNQSFMSNSGLTDLQMEEGWSL